MSGGMSIAAIAAVGISAAATAYSAYAQSEAADEQKSAQDKARQAAEEQAKKGEEANNRANAKSPDTNAIMSAAQQAAKGGVGGTMLTGPSGVDPSQLQLGKTSLLGG